MRRCVSGGLFIIALFISGLFITSPVLRLFVPVWSRPGASGWGAKENRSAYRLSEAGRHKITVGYSEQDLAEIANTIVANRRENESMDAWCPLLHAKPARIVYLALALGTITVSLFAVVAAPGKFLGNIHRSSAQGFRQGHNCFAAALQKHGRMFSSTVRPALFFINSTSAQAVLVGVVGDEAKWNSIIGTYTWRGTSATVLFIDELFRRAREHGYQSDLAMIDVGGNMGQEAVLAGMHGFRSVTFEILPHAVQTIIFNLASNCVPPGLNTIVSGGVGEHFGSVVINLAGFTAGKRTVSVNQTEGYNATVWSLDAYFLGTHGAHTRLSASPLLLKIDCEGCETGAINGALGVLSQYPPQHIIVEVSLDNIKAPFLIDLMKKYGYGQAYIVDKNDQIVASDDTQMKEHVLAVRHRQWFPNEPLCKACDILLVHRKAADLGFF